MRNICIFILALLSLVSSLEGKGTIAKTSIANQAEINYIVGGISNSIKSNTDTFIVDKVVDVKVNWQNVAPVKVAGGDKNRVLTFRLTNEGNSEDNITLSYEHNASSDFTPTDISIIHDINNNGRYDAGVDLNVSQVTLQADENVTLFIMGNIPNNNTVKPGKNSYELLKAISKSSATSGEDRANKIDVVLRKPKDSAQGIWQVRKFWLSFKKSAIVHSEDNATHTGTRITYEINAWIGGDATNHTISQVNIKDAIPDGTQYLPGTLKLDNKLLTDTADSDAGKCDGKEVEVRVGTLFQDANKTVAFDVKVK